MNRVVLVGRVTKDLELKRTTSGMSVVAFTIAIDNRVKNGAEKTTSFIPVTAWNQTAENVSKYVGKGSLIGVDGRLNQRSYTATDGHRVSITEVIAESITFLERKQDVGHTNAINNDYSSSPSSSMSDDSSRGVEVESDDDLPF